MFLKLIKKCSILTFYFVLTGLSTQITVDHNATWNHYFSVWALDSFDQTVVYMTVAVVGWNYVS